MNLSPKQQKIVNHIDGALLVKAGPGSGKTRVLTERVKKLLTVKKRGRVLALTFSNMAAEEMRQRLENDSDVGDSIERVSISTIHSFCLDLLQSRGFLVGLRQDVSIFDNEADRAAILLELMLSEPECSNQLRNHKNPNALIAKYMSAISEQKRRLILPEASNEIGLFPIIYQKYNEALASQNAMDFDDILFFTYRILVENLDVVKLYNSVYRYICIDEAQDLNEAQYRVIQALCGNEFHNIMMVGDENQSIYAFNGSSSKYMTEYFVRDFLPKLYTLDENFRSAKQIIKYANSLTGNNDDILQYYYEGELHITAFKNEAEEAQSIRSKIEELMVKGHNDIEGILVYDKIAVIARNKYVFSCIESELAQANIPYHFKQSRSGIFCETDFLKAFDLILRLLVNPMDLYHKQLLFNLVGQEMPNTINNENTHHVITQLLSINSNYRWLIKGVQGIATDGNLNFDSVLQSLRSSIPQSFTDDDKYLLEKDLEEWSSHWKRFKTRIPSELRTLVSFRNAIALGKTQSLESDSGVAFLTAHMSKGLEFEVVFIIGLSEGTFPDYRAVNIGGSAIAQEKNNMYVAATRAKRLCYLSYPQVKKMPWGDDKQQLPSRFIDKMIM